MVEGRAEATFFLDLSEERYGRITDHFFSFKSSLRTSQKLVYLIPSSGRSQLANANVSKRYSCATPNQQKKTPRKHNLAR